MVAPFDITRLTPRERIELAERPWDSLAEEDIELTPEQAAELERRRDHLAREGPKGRPWHDVLDQFDKRGRVDRGLSAPFPLSRRERGPGGEDLRRVF